MFNGFWRRGLWTAGITLRWFAGIVGWQWRLLLPLSALLELAAFLMFFRTVSRHRAATPASADASVPRKREPRMWLVMASTLGFLVTFVLNFAAAIKVSVMFASMALVLEIAAYAFWRSIGARDVVAH